LLDAEISRRTNGIISWTKRDPFRNLCPFLHQQHFVHYRKGGEYGLEYGILMGLKEGSSFNLASLLEMSLLLGLGIALVIAGYSIKGVWGAGVALFGGLVLFLYFTGLLPF